MFFFLTILVDYKVVEMMNRPTTALSPHPMTGVYTLPIYSPHPQPHTPVQQGDAAKKLIILNMRLDGIWWKGGDKKKGNTENGWKA